MRVTNLAATLALAFSMLLSSGMAVANAGYDNAMRLIQAQEYKEAYDLLLILAEGNHVNSQVLLGYMYSNGEGVTKNPKEAVAWWKLAMEEGSIAAIHLLGRSYEFGRGIEQNEKLAVVMYTSAANAGNPESQLSLGQMYRTGRGVPANYNAAVKWFTLASKQGLADAQSLLGLAYLTGQGIARDDERAYMWFNLSTYNGDPLGDKGIDLVSEDMSAAQINNAQEMSSICLESNYTDC